MQFIRFIINLIILLILLLIPKFMLGCSTFEVKNGDHLAYAHNLNQGDMGVPGLVFINKRGMFKAGRTWDELTTTKPKLVSTLTWISRYGSVTFNTFGRDFPDGGVNEAGLFIWEMSENADYPVDKKKPALSQVNWMQYMLDTCLTVEDAVRTAGEVSIDGWGWQYFIGDAWGNTAAIKFTDGKPVVSTGADMPIHGLFNSPYDWELELMRYYEGFGGLYSSEVTDPRVPRFVRYARLMREMRPTDDVAQYGLAMLQTLKVHDDPEWSVLYDETNRELYFRTRVHPDVKKLLFAQIDFSIATPTMILDMDEAVPGDVVGQFAAYSQDADKAFLMNRLKPIVPEKFFSEELSTDTCIENIARHTDRDAALATERLAGVWSNLATKQEKEMALVVTLVSQGAALSGHAVIHDNGEELVLDHLSLAGDVLRFTFFTPKGAVVEAVAKLKGNTMEVRLNGAECYYGTYTISRT